MKSKRIYLFAVIALLAIVSCDPDRVYEEFTEIPLHVWKVDHKPVFRVFLTDTVTPHNIYINIRNGSGYSYRNLYIFLTTTSPTGQWIRDTVDCILADNRGKWYGSGWGDIHELRVLYKQNIRFPVSGYYSFEFEQAMRTEHLKEIYDIGLRIEKAQIAEIEK
ncbi:MAG: gliding motility lipoprotein GldH [Bacteroidetes bacterium]|nr:gliding motility lipoprotein GldH [Bacteroidota bacterium]